MTKMEEREKRVKAKSTKITVIMGLIAIIVIQVALGIPTGTLEIVVNAISFFLLGLLFYLMYRLLIIAFNQQEDSNESREFAESVLSPQIQTEVIPIKTSEDREFICGLTDIAKFYAIINEEDKIQISVKFNNEDKLRKTEIMPKYIFKRYYRMPDKIKKQETEIL